MPVSKTRNRLIYFRVSEEEFQQFSQLCETEGARCLSDLVRSKMTGAVSGRPNEPIVMELKHLGDRIHQLDTAMQKLTAQLSNRSSVKRAPSLKRGTTDADSGN